MRVISAVAVQPLQSGDVFDFFSTGPVICPKPAVGIPNYNIQESIAFKLKHDFTYGQVPAQPRTLTLTQEAHHMKNNSTDK